MVTSTHSVSALAPARQVGVPQGVIIILAGFLPVLAIVSLAPAVPSIIAAFADVPGATVWVPLAVTAPGLMIAISPVRLPCFVRHRTNRQRRTDETVSHWDTMACHHDRAASASRGQKAA